MDGFSFQEKNCNQIGMQLDCQRTFFSSSTCLNNEDNVFDLSIQGKMKLQQLLRKQNSKIAENIQNQLQQESHNQIKEAQSPNLDIKKKVCCPQQKRKLNDNIKQKPLLNGESDYQIRKDEKLILENKKNESAAGNNSILSDYFEQLPEDYVRGMMGSMMGKGQIQKNMPIRQIRGVGKKNEQLLHNAGCTYLWQLLFLFQYRFASNKESMYHYLTEIGLKKHKQSIIEFLSSDNALVRNSVIALEGNIGAGKTTFLKSLSPYTKSNIQVFEEPVEQWKNVKYTVNNGCEQKHSHFNLLQQFYQKPEFAFQFQTYVLGTKIGHAAYTSDPFHYSQLQQQHMYSRQHECGNAVHLLERSVFADRLVFVRSLHNQGMMNDEEVSIYDSWFDQLINVKFRNLVPDGFVYLRVEPDVCEYRMKKRNRREEMGVGLDYLEGLHKMHEEWLNIDSMCDLNDESIKQLLLSRRQQMHHLRQNISSINEENFSMNVDGNICSHESIQSLFYDALDINKIPSIPKIPQNIQDSDFARIQFIDPDRNRILQKYPGIAGIPTLVIDWNQNWDVEKDVAKQNQIAQVVSAYVEWVQKFKPLIRIPELLPHNTLFPN